MVRGGGGAPVLSLDRLFVEEVGRGLGALGLRFEAPGLPGFFLVGVSHGCSGEPKRYSGEPKRVHGWDPSSSSGILIRVCCLREAVVISGLSLAGISLEPHLF